VERALVLSGGGLLLGCSLLWGGGLRLLLLGSDSLWFFLLSLAARASTLANTRGTWSAGWTLRTRWTLSTGWTRRTLSTGTTTYTTINNLKKKIIKTTLVKTSALHFILNFFANRFHCYIYKRKIIFIPI
jgi:hypothetical protein